MGKAKLAAVGPTWHFNEQGVKAGLWIRCPKCQPHGSCMIFIDWDGVKLDDSRLNRLKVAVPSGSAPSCKLSQGFLKDGIVTWT